MQAQQEKEGGREGGKVSLNIRNLICARLVNKEHPRLYNNCQKLNKQANNPNLTVPFIFFPSLSLYLFLLKQRPYLWQKSPLSADEPRGQQEPRLSAALSGMCSGHTGVCSVGTAWPGPTASPSAAPLSCPIFKSNTYAHVSTHICKCVCSVWSNREAHRQQQ